MDLSKDNSDSVCSRKQAGCIKEGFDQMSTAHAKHLKSVAHLREPGRNRLNSWKEIAAHLDREVRTVQRWEKCEGLPVRRHFHSKASSVYAFKNEVDAWLHSRVALVVCNIGELCTSRGSIGNRGVRILEHEMREEHLVASRRQSATFGVDSILSLLVACGPSRRFVVCRKQSRVSQTNFRERLR
jgi:hypothetical protein